MVLLTPLVECERMNLDMSTLIERFSVSAVETARGDLVLRGYRRNTQGLTIANGLNYDEFHPPDLKVGVQTGMGFSA